METITTSPCLWKTPFKDVNSLRKFSPRFDAKTKSDSGKYSWYEVWWKWWCIKSIRILFMKQRECLCVMMMTRCKDAHLTSVDIYLLVNFPKVSVSWVMNKYLMRDQMLQNLGMQSIQSKLQHQHQSSVVHWLRDSIFILLLAPAQSTSDLVYSFLPWC